MRKLCLFFVVLGITFSASALYAQQLLLPEALVVKTDERKWALGYSAVDGLSGIMEYVLEGETVRDWTELVSAQTFVFRSFNGDVPELKKWAAETRKALDKGIGTLEFKVLETGKNDLIYEWQLTGSAEAGDQYELARAITGEQGMHLVRYTTKKLPVSTADRKKWRKLLKGATVTSDRAQSDFVIENTADAYGNQGVMLIGGGNWEYGLDMLKKAVELDPANPSWRMNYGSFLFRYGQAAYQADRKDFGEKIFLDVVRELNAAIEHFDEAEDRDRLLKAHCYFLLGDANTYVFKDMAKAGEYYRRALELNPEHEGASNALTALTQ